MRLVALIKSLEHVCCRYRLAGYRHFLERAGSSLHLVPENFSWWNFWKTRTCLPPGDAVVVQRRFLTPGQLRELRSRYSTVIYDFDDAIYLRDSYDPRGQNCSRRYQGFVRMVQEADWVLAGNRHLAEQATLWTHPGKVLAAPTCVDFERYPLACHRPTDQPALVWIGSSSTLQGLERIAPLLDHLGRSFPTVRLRVICDKGLSLRDLPVEFLPWSEAVEPILLANSEIGISWMPDDAWSLGKCGLKVLQYMAAGLPVLANPVGIHRELVEHGETGFLVNSPEEWAEAAGRLLADWELRRRLGLAGRARVEKHFGREQGFQAWRKILETQGKREVGRHVG